MSNKNLDVLLKAMLDKSGIHAQLGQIQEIIKKYPLELTPELKQASLKNQLKSICRSVAEDFNQTFNRARLHFKQTFLEKIFSMYMNKKQSNCNKG